MLTISQLIAIVVFVVVMCFVVTEKLSRCIAALAGALVLIFTGVVTFDVGVSHIDFNTIGVLLGMMLFVAAVRQSGLFEYAALKATHLAGGDPWKIMVAFVLVTAVLSALLDNVTTVLLVGPMTLIVCEMLNVNPVPFFITEILASNVGGTATLVGDPPNIMIGSAAGYSFFDFINVDGLVVVIALVAVLLIFRVWFGRKLTARMEDRIEVMELEPTNMITDMRTFKISIAMVIAVTAAFIVLGSFGVENSVVALAAACIMIILSRADVEECVEHVEWTTIGFFCGLFVVVGGLQETGVIGMLAQWILDVANGNTFLLMIVILWVSAIASAVLDNIPFVATMIPVITAIASTGVDATPLWWALSLGACFGGNGTMVGASANVVLASISTKNGHPITFGQFTKYGFPIMIVTTGIATLYMIVRFGLPMLV